jgi:hypothetical protein
MAPPKIKRKKWSFAYSKFVDNPNADLLEIIAYALYKRDKANWVRDQCSIGKEPSGPNLIKWSESNSTEEKIEEYKISARNILSRFESRIEARILPVLQDELAVKLKEEISGVNAAKVVQIDQNLDTLLRQTSGSRTFWANVRVGITASFFYSLGLAGLYLIFWALGFPFPAPPWGDSRPIESRIQSSEALDKIPQKTARPR